MGKWLPRDFIVLISVATFLFERFFVSPSDSCNCSKRHPQTMFCNSEFVILAKVFNSTGEVYPTYSTMFNSGEMRYLRFKVKVRRVYRGDHAIKPGANIHVYTSFSRPLCAAVVPHAGYYVFSGSFERGKASISKCTMAYDYSLMKKRSRRMLRRYEFTCHKCKIRKCYGKKNCGRLRDYLRRRRRNSKDFCLLDVYPRNHTCYYDFAYCKPKLSAGGKCRWGKARKKFRACRDGLRHKQTP